MIAEKPTQASTGSAPQKRSLFNKPSWSRPQALSKDTDLFHRSNQTYVNLAAEAERARKRKQARRERERARQNVIGERAGKRRLVSEDEDDDSSSDENSSHSSHEETKTSPTHAKHHHIPRCTSPQKLMHSPKSLLQQYEAKVAANKKGQEQEQKQNLKVSDIIDLEDEEDSSALPGKDIVSESPTVKLAALPEEDDQQVSDEEFPELARQAREKARRKRLEEDIAPMTAKSQDGQPSLYQSMPPTSRPDPILQILITSSIDNTTPLIVSRKLSQRLKDVRLAWANRQNFNADFTDTVFLTWRGKRVFDVTTCRSLGITIDAIGRLSTKGGSWEEEDGQIHMEAMTAKIFEAYKKAKRNEAIGQEDGAAQEEVVAVQDHEAQVRIILKSKGLDDLKLQVRPSTLVSKIVNAFRSQYQIGGEKDVFLSFDGERLSPTSKIDETELSDMDTLEVYCR